MLQTPGTQIPGRRPLRYMALALGVAFTLSAQVNTHQPPYANNPQNQSTIPSAAPPTDASDPFRAGMEARRLKMQNDDRHKRMVADTEKLLALSTELKEDVSKTTKNELSLDVIKKAAEIEKLAHDVKERMRS